MNFRYVFQLLGLLLLGLGAAMAAAAAGGALTWLEGREADLAAEGALLVMAGVCVLGGGGLWVWHGRKRDLFFGQREALLLVAMAWTLGSAVAAAPLYLWARWTFWGEAEAHVLQRMAACFFEATSGLTTTGSTIIDDLGAMPPALLLWRSLLQWMGALGIVVLFVAVLPMLGVGGKRVFQLEVSGPQPQGVRPRIADTARVLWFIYIGFSLALFAAFMLAGMSWFDALCHMMTCISTAGFSTRDESMGGFDSWGIHLIAMAAMVLGGVNFGLYYQMVRRRFDMVWRDGELRAYLLLMLLGGVIVTASLHGTSFTTTQEVTIENAGLMESARHGFFNVISLHTTTGYATAHFEEWDFLPQVVLVAAMLVGGCGGSTSAGMKVIRLLIVWRVILAELERIFRPHLVRTIKIGPRVIDNEIRLGVLAYVAGLLMLMAGASVALMLMEQGRGVDFLTAGSAALATLNNIGPGLGAVGSDHTYSFFSDPSMVLMSVLMILGRLEIYVVLALLVPRFWRGD